MILDGRKLAKADTLFSIAFAALFIFYGTSTCKAEAPQNQCDIEAAHPADPNRKAPGKQLLEINASIAISACETALRQFPNEPRLHYQLGRTYQAAKRYDEAFSEYMKAANLGYAPAQNNLGDMYNNGIGVPKNYTIALSWFRRAASQNFAIAQSNLGAMYERGSGVPKDYAIAVSWYQKAVDQGYAPALTILGDMYANGSGVKKDYAIAVSWYRKAAEQGYANAQNNLGIMYEGGFGVPKDYAIAVSWYQKAADQGLASAETNLGNMYLDGQGVAKDAEKAMSLFKKAAEQGDPAAKKALQDIQNPKKLSTAPSGPAARADTAANMDPQILKSKGLAFLSQHKTTWDYNERRDEITESTVGEVVSTQTNGNGISAEIRGTCNSDNNIIFTTLIVDDTGKSTVNVEHDNKGTEVRFRLNDDVVQALLPIDKYANRFTTLTIFGPNTISHFSSKEDLHIQESIMKTTGIQLIDYDEAWGALAELNTDRGPITVSIPLLDPSIQSLYKMCFHTSVSAASVEAQSGAAELSKDQALELAIKVLKGDPYGGSTQVIMSNIREIVHTEQNSIGKCRRDTSKVPLWEFHVVVSNENNKGGGEIDGWLDLNARSGKIDCASLPFMD